jgi:hypothetical protein
MILRPRIFGRVGSIATLVLLAHPACGHELAGDPRWIATQWMLQDGIEEEVRTDLTRVVVDTLNRPGWHRRALEPLRAEEVASSRAIAGHLGSRTGALNDLWVCPEDLRDPQARLEATGSWRSGCSFADGLRVVLQIDAPEATDKGVTVWVASWTHRRSGIDFYSQELTLERTAQGSWDVVGLGYAMRAHW